MLTFQLKRSYAGYSREQYESGSSTISTLIRNMTFTVLGEDPGPLPEGLHYEFHFRRQLLRPSDDTVMDIMGGGGTVYAKVFDEAGYEYDWIQYEWEAKPRRNPVARELVRYDDGYDYWILETD